MFIMAATCSASRSSTWRRTWRKHRKPWQPWPFNGGLKHGRFFDSKNGNGQVFVAPIKMVTGGWFMMGYHENYVFYQWKLLSEW